MRVHHRMAVIGTALTVAVSGLTVLTAGVATAEPCGVTGVGSTPFGNIFGSSGFGSSGPSGANPRGPQGTLPDLGVGNTKAVSWVTGPQSPNSTYDRFGISGTDLGISWDNGKGQTLMAFGDTFGNCSVPSGQWRSNVLMRSSDANLADGIAVPDGAPGDRNSGSVLDVPNFSREIVTSLKIPEVEATTIPTAAISIGDDQYLSYMSVRTWGAPGRWVTNFSAIAKSSDNGQTWTTDQSTIRVNTGITLPGGGQVDRNQGKFQQVAFMKDKDGYIYQYGTPNGRFGAAYLSRFLPQDITTLSKYQYYTGAGTWSNDIADVKDTDVVVGDPVSEMSVAWNDYLNKYVMLYGNEVAGAIVARTADKPEGPWSGEKTLISRQQNNGGIYAPFIHPRSSGRDLYFTASQWSGYNVMLMRTDLDALR